MDLGLKSRSALVLAASKGLGRASALALAREGANVMIGARTAAEVEATARELREATGADVRGAAVDVTDPAQCEAIVSATRSAFGRIDILVNNAGGPPFGSFAQFDDDAWRKALELNLMSTVRLCRLVLPEMQAAQWGRIINITSLTAKSVVEGSVLSTAGRLGIMGMAKLLADEVAPFGITVNSVAPGFILTDRMRDVAVRSRLARGLDEAGAVEDLGRGIPAKRPGRPAELGDLVAFLASDCAAYITGTTIPIDGGMIRAIY